MNATANKPKEIVSEIEKDVSTLRLSLERANKFSEAGKLYKVQGNILKAEEMAWETALFYLSYTNYKDREKSKQRFSPMVTYTNGSVFPDPRSFSRDSIEYFRKRAKETTNPIHRARYGDIVWELQRDHQYARIAINSYIKCFPIFMKNRWMYELSDSLLRASELALSLNDPSEIVKVKLNILKAIKNLAKTRQYRFCLELIDALLKLKSNVNKKEFNFVVQVALIGANYYETEVPDGFLLQRAFLERLVLINKALEKHSEATKYDMQIAISYEKEAQWKLKNYPQGHSVAASIYEEATQKYADLGVSKKVGEIKKKIQKHNLIAAQTEMKTIVSKVSVPVEPIKDFIDKLLSLSLSDALNNIARDKMFVPGVSRIRKITENQKEHAPVSFIIPRVSIRNGKPALKSKDEKEIFEDHLVGNIVRSYKIASNIISLTIRKLVDTKGLDADSFAAILENSKIFKKEKLEIIKIGLERHFAGDYVSSIHVLTPQLEAAIREILKELGETTISLHQGVLREKPLDEVLRSPKMKSFLGENIWNYLKAFLVDKRGDNIRHDVAHGLISKERCSENISTTILHQLLILSQLIFSKSIS